MKRVEWKNITLCPPSAFHTQDLDREADDVGLEWLLSWGKKERKKERRELKS